MAADKATLISDLLAIFNSSGKTPAEVAADFANAIETYVKSGDVKVNGQTGAGTPGGPLPITNQIGKFE